MPNTKLILMVEGQQYKVQPSQDDLEMLLVTIEKGWVILTADVTIVRIAM